jgi:DNA-binding MarR family transcriptional regulator
MGEGHSELQTGVEGIVIPEADSADARRVYYRLTEKGIDLAPVLLDLLLWGARHEDTGAPPGLVARLRQDREGFLAEVRRRWRERDPAPLILSSIAARSAPRTS